MTYRDIYIDTMDDRFVVCGICGSLVLDTNVHDAWHSQVVEEIILG